MSTLRNHYIIILSLLLTACTDLSQSDNNTESKKDSTQFSNIVEVKYLGDTTRIEIEKKGDTLIKHFIDLKKDDGFDNSYNAKCFYERRNIDSTVIIASKKIKIVAILSEIYQTEFSKGKNNYFITHSGDTVFGSHILEVIK